MGRAFTFMPVAAGSSAPELAKSRDTAGYLLRGISSDPQESSVYHPALIRRYLQLASDNEAAHLRLFQKVFNIEAAHENAIKTPTTSLSR
jgi:hypothetical protein